jgi:hypothetical protein
MAGIVLFIRLLVANVFFIRAVLQALPIRQMMPMAMMTKLI